MQILNIEYYDNCEIHYILNDEGRVMKVHKKVPTVEEVLSGNGGGPGIVFMPYIMTSSYIHMNKKDAHHYNSIKTRYTTTKIQQTYLSIKV